jgi:tetratricopeptide (TPR) repeat protein
MAFRFGAAAFILVFAIYLFLGGMGLTDRGNPNARDAPYNLLARGLLSGHLYLDREAPPFLAHLTNPYDRQANADARDIRLRLHDMSYYRGKLYLYFGVAPALLVFIPWHLLTGGWLPQWVAVVVLCSAGLLVNLSLVWAVRTSAFAGARSWLAAPLVFVLGLASFAPLLLARADLWEVPIALSYLAISGALRCLWETLDAGPRSVRWMAAASALLGVAFASRPTMLPNAAILILPFAFGKNARNPLAWAAAAIPFALCGAGVAAYNAARFGNPFDFGLRYALDAYPYRGSVSFIPSNLGAYLFRWVRVTPFFPYLAEPDPVPRAFLPAHYDGAQDVAGALVCSPVLWMALVLPFNLRQLGGRGRLTLFATALVWVASSSLLFFASFYYACARYAFEFIPALAMLAVLGLLATESDPRPRFRRVARWAWIPALAVSSLVPVLFGIDRCVRDHNVSGLTSLSYGDFGGAEHDFAIARSLSPANPGSRLGSAVALLYSGRRPEARAALEALVRDFPAHALAHYFLGAVLAADGRRGEAASQFETAHRLDPDNRGIARALETALAAGR